MAPNLSRGEVKSTAITQAQVDRVSGAGAKTVLQRVGDTIQAVKDAWFGPLQPLQPTMPEDVKGRQLQYPVGYNTITQTRYPEGLDNSDLRALARNCWQIALAIETRKDQLENVNWDFRVKTKKGEKPPKTEDPRLQVLRDFFNYPDPDDGLSLKRWQRKINDDLFILDAPAIWIERARDGKPYAFHALDSATIKPLISAGGRRPTGDQPAYQQWLFGTPGAFFKRTEMIWMPRNPRTDRLFGYSPVEQIYIIAHIAIRKALMELGFFTEGTIPEVAIPAPETWTPEQLLEMQVYLDSMLTANYGQQSKVRIFPAGLDKALELRKTDRKEEYDEWLARIVMFCFSLPATAFTNKVNRATAEQTASTAKEEGLGPLLNYWKELMTLAVVLGWGWNDIECFPADEKEVDPLKQAQVDEIYIRTGKSSVDEIRERDGQDAIGQPNAVITASGMVKIGTIGDQEAEQKAADALALAAAQPKPAPGDEPKKPKPGQPVAKAAAGGGRTEKGKARRVVMLPRTGHQKAEKYLATALTRFFKAQASKVSKALMKHRGITLEKDDEGSDFDDWDKVTSIFEPQLAAVAKRGAFSALSQLEVTDEGITDSVSDEVLGWAQDRAAEMVGKKWVDGELIDNPNAEWSITQGTRDMVNDIITRGIDDGLSAKSIQQNIMESYAFDPDRAMNIARTELAYAHTQGNLIAWKDSGVVEMKESLLASDHDHEDECNTNADAGAIPIGDNFPSGDDGPPYHPNCECALVAIVKPLLEGSMEPGDED